MSDDGDGSYMVCASLGDMELTVEGDDKEWVDETFDEKWTDRLDEASEMKEALRRADRSSQ